MDPLELLKKKLGLPPNFKLSENAESRLKRSLEEAKGDINRALWIIKIDCAACCAGCILCEFNV